ncbi:MAG TPA: ABC transporter substrate-binding protein [Methanocorpusculum sp.]|nr:ABC transporter substrate-binding protein [Methanocorpusculum sp.]
MKKSGIFLVLLCITAFCCCPGCIESGNGQSDEGMITITDALGRTVTIPDNPEKIAVSGSGALRYFVYLGVDLDRVVIVDYGDCNDTTTIGDSRPYRLAHPEMLTIPVLGSKCSDVDAEKLIASGAEVLFLSTFTANLENANEIQEKTNIPVVMFYTGDYVTDAEKIQDTFHMIGTIFHKQERTESLINYFDTIEKDLQSRVPDLTNDQKPSVYIAGVSFRGGHGIDGTNPYYYPFAVLNARNIAGNVKGSESIGYVQVAKEQILDWDPDIIFIDLSTLNAAGGGAINELKNDPSYKELTAVKTGQIYAVNPHTYYVVNFETTLANAYYIGKILYPETFADIDPEAKANEIYKFVDGSAIYGKLKANLHGLSYQKLEI